MYEQREPRFEALVYTQDRSFAARCAEALAELPVDWVMLHDSGIALNSLAKSRFDFVVLDLDCDGHSSILLDTVNSGINLRSVVLAVTSTQVDPNVLALCYESQIFYPVRQTEIQDALYRSIPFAERLSAKASRVAAGGRRQDGAGRASDHARVGVADEFLLLAQWLGRTSAMLLRAVLRMKHSLSILAQERTASLLAAAGAIWFVQEVTRDFHGIEFVAPPSAGPTYLIALALLLWLCAKHRRICDTKTQAVAAQVSKVS